MRLRRRSLSEGDVQPRQVAVEPVVGGVSGELGELLVRRRLAAAGEPAVEFASDGEQLAPPTLLEVLLEVRGGPLSPEMGDDVAQDLEPGPSGAAAGADLDADTVADVGR